MKDRFLQAQPWLSTLARLFLAGVFILSGWPKFTNGEGTVRSVRAFNLMPEVFVRPFAYGLPLLELAVAVLLVLGLATRVAAIITAALMVMFMFGIVMAWARGLDINCGCFGYVGGKVADPVPGYIRDLLRDTGFLLAALFLVRWPRSALSLDGFLGLTSPASPTSPSPTTTDAA